MELNQLGKVVFKHFCEQNAIREVPGKVFLGLGEGVRVDPVEDCLKFILVDGRCLHFFIRVWLYFNTNL